MSGVVLWIALGVLGWVYVGYPGLVLVLARFAPWRPHPVGETPTLSVAIAVHDEMGVIEERIADVFAQDDGRLRLREVLVGSDGSTDRTNEIVARLAVSEPRLGLVSLPRAGQTPTQAALIAAATGDVVVLTDAETRFRAGCLSALADAFRDPRVGVATGRLEWRDVDATATAANEGLYWRYERTVRGLESRAGLLTAVTGALLAVRRTSYRTVPPSASMDHLLPLYVREAGGAVVYVADAVATDRPISGLREQYANRTRTATRGIRANLSMAIRLGPFSHPRAALAIWSHKLLRWATPIFGTIAFVAATAEAGLGSILGWAVLLVVLGGALCAAAGQLIAATGRRPPRILAFARSFAIVNLAFARAWIEVIRGRRIEAWHRAEWERPG
ncbi:MAG: glycosyltransferase [Chloroflexi bacterium]|nr:MAG: glycosyltransferase [Chloroflexota bacterium]